MQLQLIKENYFNAVKNKQIKEIQLGNPSIEFKKPHTSLINSAFLFLGYPIWWSDLPMAGYTFLENNDFNGKTIIPFCTNEGSGMGSSERFIKQLCPNSTIMKGTSIHGAEAANADSEAQQIAGMAR